ncbi:MAG: inositol monophosphatase family protein [Rickettsiales bacterium]
MDANFLTFTHQLVDVAGDIIRPYFGAHGVVKLKADESPVSRADREAEAAIRMLIATRCPDHGIYGEEYGQQATNKKYVWVIDPIDGTRAFLAGGQEWGTLIALCEDGVPILGILNQPITGERWVGARGTETIYYRHSSEGIKTKTRTCPTLASANISTTSRNYFTPPQASAFVKLAEQCGEVIENGDCYAYGLLARGMRDVVVDAGLKPYDILALVPIIEGAGGRITGWDGSALTLSNYRDVVAVGDEGLAEVCRLLRP